MNIKNRAYPYHIANEGPLDVSEEWMALDVICTTLRTESLQRVSNQEGPYQQLHVQTHLQSSLSKPTLLLLYCIIAIARLYISTEENI
jgi:hypothetical protein